MSRRHKIKAPKSAGSIQAPSASMGFGGISGSGFSAADSSPNRGFVYFPQLDSKLSVSQFTRTETLRKARWLVSNTGFARHLQNTIARLVGPMIPQPSTRDKDWNVAALEFFQRTQGSRLIHDQAGMESFNSRQRTVVRASLTDGDCFLGLTTTTTGNARTVFYEAPQIGNSYDTTQEKGWFDGVKIDRYGKKTDYCILQAGSYNREGEVFPANKFLHCGRFESPRSPRGLTAYIHAILRMLDVREVQNDIFKGIKSGNIVGFYLTNQLLSSIEKAPAGGRLAQEDYRGRPRDNVPNPKPATYEEVIAQGGQFMQLGQGQDLKVLNDSRPHQNQQAFIESIIHDIAAGFGMPVEAVWSISGITGPAVRYIMRMAEKTLNEIRDQLKEQFCQPYWVYTMALAQKSGALPWCKDQDWWKCEWVAPSALTIDAGRDSAAGIKELQYGAGSLRDWYGEDGQDWQKVIDQIAQEKAYIAKKEQELGLPPGAIQGEREVNQAEQQAGEQTEEKPPEPEK